MLLSHHWCHCIIEFSCCKMSKAEILQNTVILFVQDTPLQAPGAFCEAPRTAPNKQALQVICEDPRRAPNRQALRVRHLSICSVSAASRNLAKVDCPAEIAVMLPGLQGYSARISWHCIRLRVCTQIPAGPQPAAPRSGRTTCSQKG